MKNSIDRRIFLKRASKLAAGTYLVSVAGFNLGFDQKILPPHRLIKQSKDKSVNSKTIYEFGVEGRAPHEAEELDAFLEAVRNLGAGFFICQFSPEFKTSLSKHKEFGWEGSVQGFKDFATAFRKYNLTFFANQEVTNYSLEGDILDENGNDILAHPDKTHRWDITGDLLKNAAKNPEFRGVVYDEAEHGQLRRGHNTNNNGHSTGRTHPYFAITDGMTLEHAYNAVYKSAKNISEGYREVGVSCMTENVFPSLLFLFARAGFDVAIKFMKESIDPVYAAIAMGAAREYGVELCITPDMWGFDWSVKDHFPGHPPEELRASLLYAYWIGASRIFVENIKGLIKKKIENGIISYEATEYGKVYKWFVKEYVPAHPRNYTFRDIRAKIAIIRFDDSDWGQIDSRFTDNLYGAVNLQSTPETAAWFQIWNLLTHGQTKNGGLNFNSKKYAGVPHDFFYPLKDVIVYDHLASDKEMEGLELVFLTGMLISPETLKAVRAFVRKGGLCISLTSLAPVDLAGKLGLISDGSGQWLLVKDFLSEEVKNAVLPFLGDSDEISYLIAKQRLTVKCGKDRNTISIYLQDEKDMTKDGQISESSRVW